MWLVLKKSNDLSSIIRHLWYSTIIFFSISIYHESCSIYDNHFSLSLASTWDGCPYLHYQYHHCCYCYYSYIVIIVIMSYHPRLKMYTHWGTRPKKVYILGPFGRDCIPHLASYILNFWWPPPSLYIFNLLYEMRGGLTESCSTKKKTNFRPSPFHTFWVAWSVVWGTNWTLSNIAWFSWFYSTVSCCFGEKSCCFGAPLRAKIVL